MTLNSKGLNAMAHVIDEVIPDRDGSYTVRTRNADDTEPGCWRTLRMWQSLENANKIIAHRASLRPGLSLILEAMKGIAYDGSS
jgi:hypothetical protein